MNYKFTIVVPVYNEEDNLERVEKELLKYTTIASVPTKVLFVNDGSTDKSLDLIEAICKRQIGFEFISFENNKGLSAAIKAGFDYTTTELVGYIDSDLQTAPEDFNLLLKYIDVTLIFFGLSFQNSTSGLIHLNFNLFFLILL